MKIALVGMPNCGKSTLFNRLTGKNVSTGNREGVTVSAATGVLRAAPHAVLTDLPGVYAPVPHSEDERLTLRVLENSPPDLVLFVADGTQLARADALFAKIRREHRTVLVVNMCDELEKAGTLLDPRKLENFLDLPVFAVSARSGRGVAALAQYLKAQADPCGQATSPATEETPIAPGRTPCSFCAFSCAARGANPAARAGNATDPATAARAKAISRATPANPATPEQGALPIKNAAPEKSAARGGTKSSSPGGERTPSHGGEKKEFPGGAKFSPSSGSEFPFSGKETTFTPSGAKPAAHTGNTADPATAARAKAITRTAHAPTSPATPGQGALPIKNAAPDRSAAHGKMGFPAPSGAKPGLAEAARAVLLTSPPRGRLQNMADRLFLTPWTGFPLLLLFLSAALFFSFGAPGGLPAGWFSALLIFPLRQFFLWISGLLPPFFAAFLTDGVLAGTAAVLDFAPRLFLLFFFLTILEDSGYLARAGALCAPLFRFFGLSGEAAVPLLLGVGCSVPAVLSARHIRDGGTRRLTILLVPFIPCSARLPVLATLSVLLFASPLAARVIPVLGGAVLFLLFAFLLSRKSRPLPFAGELPRFRFPSAQNVLRVSMRRTGHFLKKAGLVIPLAAALLWLFSHITPRGMPTAAPEGSLLALVSGAIAPIFAPLGFGCWQAVAALLSGIAAKETVLSALAVFAGGELSALSAFLSPRGALSFLCFFATYCPCAATQIAVRREGGRRALAACLALSFLGAYLLSFLVYHI